MGLTGFSPLALIAKPARIPHLDRLLMGDRIIAVLKPISNQFRVVAICPGFPREPKVMNPLLPILDVFHQSIGMYSQEKSSLFLIPGAIAHSIALHGFNLPAEFEQHLLLLYE